PVTKGEEADAFHGVPASAPRTDFTDPWRLSRSHFPTSGICFQNGFMQPGYRFLRLSEFVDLKQTPCNVAHFILQPPRTIEQQAEPGQQPPLHDPNQSCDVTPRRTEGKQPLQ